ncbi:hypothetical protein EIP86_010437 [Pleurotus ostreatoroseus]|nr:hypothetical protein EIP86_010437 [Pleurotus ostreatoroseus]
MRSSSSNHVEHIRDRIAHTDGAVSRRPLNVKQLLELLSNHENQISKANKMKGKKRAAEDIPAHGRHKRLKGNQQQESSTREFPTSIPVLQHVYEISYTTKRFSEEVNDPQQEVDMEVDWSQEEDTLVEWLQDLRSNTGCSKLTLGSVDLHHRDTNMLVSVPETSGSHLVTVPHLADDTATTQNPLLVFAVLRQTGRAELEATLSMVTIDCPPPDILPFKIVLSVEVSLLLPAIFTQMRGVDDTQRRALRIIFPESEWPGEIRDVDVPFLYTALRPAPPLDPATLECLQPPALTATLLPFQRRSVAWLLEREEKVVGADGTVITKSENSGELPLFWERVRHVYSTADKGERSEVWYINRLTGQLTDTEPEYNTNVTRGGILAEEPGLGKTLECIALILLNPSIGRGPMTKRWDPETQLDVKEIQTTLIVTPQSLAQQWIDELAVHAPSLKVLVYEGWSKVKVPISETDVAAAVLRRAKISSPRKNRKTSASARERSATSTIEDADVKMHNAAEEQEPIVDWCTYVNEYDVCITTYNVLAHDLGVARPPPQRPRRDGATYANLPRPRSPLVMCEWHRVIMDEVQMVGGGKTADMVSLIPRLSSFAVSGTPARSQVSDLIHVLRFLRIPQLVQEPKLWVRLQRPEHVNQFVELFNKYAIRTTKASVKDELTIPRQTRFLVPIQLGKVEKHVYDQNLETALLELGLDARGVAVSENWQIDTGLLRTWLRKLRGICTHPQVGQLQNSDKNKSGALKTIGEVLEGMKDQNWRSFMEDRKLKIQALATLAQLQQQEDHNINRYQVALNTLLFAEKEMDKVIKEIRLSLDKHDEAGKSLMAEEANSDDVTPETSKDKGKQPMRHETSRASEDGEEDGLPQTAAGEEHRNKKRALQQRLRECQIVMHKVKFLMGDVYHALGESHSADENAAYAAAEDLRRVLLMSTESAAKRAMSQLLYDADKAITEKELYIDDPYCTPEGNKSRDLIEEANDMVHDVLNPQASLLWKWRVHLVSLLTQPLTSEDGDADGQEYARSLETQGEAEIYLQAYAALLADRKEAMTSERTLLAALDVKEKKARRTKAANKAAEALLEDEVLKVINDLEVQPENQVLHKELHDERKAILDAGDPSRAVRSVMVDLNNIAARIPRKNDPEKIIAVGGAQKLRELLSEENKLMEKLQNDLGRLRKAFNERISYFRQLQEISDTVAEAEWDGSLQNAMANNDTERAALDAKINTGHARQRYLDYLAAAQADGTLDEDQESCILCKCEFTRGYVTPCAHVFCEGCMKEWLTRKEGKACPICRVVIDRDELQRFAVGQDQAVLRKHTIQLSHKDMIPRSKRRIEYNSIDQDVYENIQLMESHGSYGSKIQTLVQHLIYIETVEPGAKSIVFSAWEDSLQNISCVRIDQRSSKEHAAKKFCSDPSIQVLLLHGDRENAGLNVTCASRVFLLESVVHHGFEIQAIARIDRMGQTRPTEEGTVERNILDLAARQGLSLYTKENSAGTLTAAPIMNPGKKAVDAPSKKVQKGDFVFKTDDMLAIFFPHLFEDAEYLISEDTDPQPDSAMEIDSQGPVGEMQINAVAGPSRSA